jgi:hypothetical protein
LLAAVILEGSVRKNLHAVVVALFVIGPSLACFAQAAKIEKLGPLAESGVPENVSKVLEPTGYRVLLPDGSVACEIWLRQSVPAQAKTDVEGVLYPQLAESTLVGVISFPKASTDYRGQPIRAGFYTLRYELLPNDGNHLGVAPDRDFVLLIPAAADTDPDAKFTYNQLLDLSRQATRTQHPGPLSMVPGTGGAEPAVSQNEDGNWVFSAALKLGASDVPFGLIVKGSAPQ